MKYNTFNDDNYLFRKKIKKKKIENRKTKQKYYQKQERMST